MARTTINTQVIPDGTIVSADLSYPLTNFSSTGIDDNASSTALTIDASENVGIGATSPSSKAHIKGDLRIEDATDTTSRDHIISIDTTGALTFDDSVSGERMRVDWNGNVGIGISAPTEKLTVKGDVTLTPNSTSAADRLAALTIGKRDSGTVDYMGQIDFVGSGTNGFATDIVFSSKTGDFYNSTTNEHMRIDSSGSVGIGVTAPDNTLHVQGASTTGGPSTGNVALFEGPSGTNGLKIFVDDTANASGLQTIGLDPLLLNPFGGNVGIGTTSPARKLDISAATNDGIRIASANALIGAGAAGGDTQLIYWNGSNAYYGRSSLGGSISQHEFRTGGTTRLTITSSGNVGIGSTGPSQKLQVEGGDVLIKSEYNATGTTDTLIYFAARASGNWRNAHIGQTGNALIFANGGIGTTHTNGAERMRIDSSGSLLVGTTTSSGSGDNGWAFFADGGAYSRRNGTASGPHFRFFNNADVSTTQVGNITSSGSSTSYNTTSDYRLKENIVDAPAGNIDAIRVRSFNWKADGSHQTYGMVAQELVDVAPEAVSQGETNDDMWSVDYSKLVPMMIKEIQDLKAEVAALKGE